MFLLLELPSRFVAVSSQLVNLVYFAVSRRKQPREMVEGEGLLGIDSRVGHHIEDSTNVVTGTNAVRAL